MRGAGRRRRGRHLGTVPEPALGRRSAAIVIFGQEALSAAGNTVLVSVAAGVAALAFAQLRAMRETARA